MILFFLLIIALIGFGIYMYLNEGFIYIASKHFEKEINFKKFKEKQAKNTCRTCGVIIPEGEKYCEACKKKQLISYSNTNEFGNFKNN